MLKRIFFVLLVLFFCFLYPVPDTLHPVSAHEAYVLTKAQFNQGLQTYGADLFSPLKDLNNLLIFFSISFGVIGLITLNFLFNESKLGKRVDRLFLRLSKFGPIIARVTIALALFFSALTFSFLGPELSLKSLPMPEILRITILTASLFLVVGFLTEIVAIVCLLIFMLGFAAFGLYQLSYLNYLGELIVLILFGSRVLSLDQKIFGHLKRLRKLEGYESTILRVFYGLALVYAAVTIKFLHPQIPLEVVSQYNLTQFNLLFPQDPQLLVLGAALAEITIGLFIVLGFQLRLTVLVSLFYITLSLLFFKEAVWPHLLLYGISFNLMTTKSRFSLDSLLDQKKYSKKN